MFLRTLDSTALVAELSDMDLHHIMHACMEECEGVFPYNKTQSLLIIFLLMGCSGFSFISCSWQNPLTQVWTHFNHFHAVFNKVMYYVGEDLFLCPDIIL